MRNKSEQIVARKHLRVLVDGVPSIEENSDGVMTVEYLSEAPLTRENLHSIGEKALRNMDKGDVFEEHWHLHW